jgi:cytochrome P450
MKPGLMGASCDQGQPKMSAKYPPGPSDGLLGITFRRRMRQSALGFAAEVARDYGDFTYVRVGWVRLYFVNRPELIREVLATKVKSFPKLRRQMRALRKIEGDGLVASDGEIWTRHRPVVQGSFHNRHFERYAEVINDFTQRRIAGWSTGTPFNMADEMNELALEIIAKIVFDVDLEADAARLRDAVHVFRTDMQREVSTPVPLPDWLPLPAKIRQRRAVAEVNALIWREIRARRASETVGDDMLGQMLAAARKVPGRAITDAEIRDEAATLFVAGHDTTSAALAWFWFCLASNPAVEQRVLQEINQVVGQRTPTFADIPRLRYLDCFVKESMRLYPAAGFLFGREAAEDVELGGYKIRRGSWVFIAPYIVHRDPNVFANPEVFDPTRFGQDRIDSIPPYGYIPFGSGPRICVGNSMATMQIMLMAITILQKFRVELAQGPPELELEIVVRPKGGLQMSVTPRFGERRQAA